jgi:anti-sigma B factor antagonist
LDRILPSPAEHFTCAIERTSKAMHLRPMGEVDLGTVPILWSNLKAMLEDNLNVIVDLKGIEDIDSTGIKALLDAHQLFIQRGQRFVASEPNAICRKLFGITGVDKTIPIFEFVAAALASFRFPAELPPGSR